VCRYERDDYLAHKEIQTSSGKIIITSYGSRIGLSFKPNEGHRFSVTGYILPPKMALGFISKEDLKVLAKCQVLKLLLKTSQR